MVVIAYNEEETIFMDNVDFINQDNTSVDVKTKDGSNTQIACAEGTELSIFTDNGVKIYPEPTTT